MKPTIASLSLLLVMGSSLAGEVKFAAKPKATKAGGKVKITFAVKTPTDVEVAILDAKGQVARHLAAGVLGKNAPAPLKKGSLSQSLEWDFKDDYGKKLPAGAYRVRVGLGLKPTFDKILGHNPNTLGLVYGLTVGPGGELFALNVGHHLHRNFGSTMCNVFDRKAGYKRTIMPYQAKCFPEKVKDFGVLDLGEKGKHPWIHANHLKTVYPFLSQPEHQHPAVMPDGRFILTMKVRGKGAVLVAVDAKDGSIPEDGAFGPSLGSKDMRAAACLAAAPDGKSIYVSGVASQKRYKPIKWKHAVYRAKWGEKTITPFIGNPEEAGKGGTGLNSPQGVALDKDGNIYVADRGNNRIAVFSPEGKFLNELPVESPYMLGVHKKSGAVYVLAGGDPPDSIVKFKSREVPRPVYSQEVPHVVRSFKGKKLKRLDAYPVFTLDASAEEPVLWVGSSTIYARRRLSRLVEKNGKLSEPEEKGRGSGFRACREIQVDRKREEVYFQQRAGSAEVSPRPGFVKINGADGKVLKSLPMSGTGSHFCLGQDGYVYVVNVKKNILRYDRDFKPAPFAGSDSNSGDRIPGHRYGLHIMGRGLAVSRDGSIYVLHENVPKVHTRYGISVWGPDGKLRKENLVGSLSPAALSLRMDAAGNLYVGDPVKPAGQIVPPDLQGKVDVTKLNTHHGKYPDNHYPIMYGSILKFPPTGGAGVGPKIEGRKGLLAYDVPVGIKDDLWQYYGVSLIPSQHGAGYNHYVTGACACEGLRFDVDGYGRVFSPDAGRFRVVILDTNGNEIGTFGSYGNQDSAGPGSAVPEPKIPLAWPSAVGVSDRAAYVADVLNRRMLRVKLGYAAKETCDVK